MYFSAIKRSEEIFLLNLDARFEHFTRVSHFYSFRQMKSSNCRGKVDDEVEKKTTHKMTSNFRVQGSVSFSLSVALVLWACKTEEKHANGIKHIQQND